MARHGWMNVQTRTYEHFSDGSTVQCRRKEGKGRGWYRRDKIEGGEEQFKLLCLMIIQQ